MDLETGTMGYGRKSGGEVGWEVGGTAWPEGLPKSEHRRWTPMRVWLPILTSEGLCPAPCSRVMGRKGMARDDGPGEISDHTSTDPP